MMHDDLVLSQSVSRRGSNLFEKMTVGQQRLGLSVLPYDREFACCL
jgi:hypothetical protein